MRSADAEVLVRLLTWDDEAQDCLTVETVRKAGHVPLGTFDKNLRKLEDTNRL